MYNLLVSYSRMYTRKTGSKPKKKTSWASGNSSFNSKIYEKTELLLGQMTINLV